MAQLVMTDPGEAYRRQKILSASPAELVIMLYDELRKSVLMAKRAMKKEDYDRSTALLTKAFDIITELIDSLDAQYEISNQLFDLYQLMQSILGQIEASKDYELCDDVAEMVSELRNTWHQAMDQQSEVPQLQEELG